MYTLDELFKTNEMNNCLSNFKGIARREKLIFPTNNYLQSLSDRCAKI